MSLPVVGSGAGITGELAMSLPVVGSGAGMTGELAMSLPVVGSGAGMTGELAISLPVVGSGAGMTGELAAAKTAAVSRTMAMIAERTLNVFKVIGPSLSWFEVCIEIVP